MFDLLKGDFDLKSHPIVIYCRKLVGQVLAMALLLLVAAALTTVALYVCKLAWLAYTDTPVGQRFVASFPSRAAIYTNLFRQDLISLAIQVTFMAFFICLPLAIVCQLVYLIRLLYLPFGALRRVIFWGLPLTVLTALQAKSQLGLYPFTTALLVATIPTLCVFGGCFRMANELLPEIGTLVQLAVERLRPKK